MKSAKCALEGIFAYGGTLGTTQMNTMTGMPDLRLKSLVQNMFLCVRGASSQRENGLTNKSAKNVMWQTHPSHSNNIVRSLDPTQTGMNGPRIRRKRVCTQP